jgi:hypothetical protein
VTTGAAFWAGQPRRPVVVVAALRCAVGAGLIGKPDIATNGDAPRRVLVRTIGIRDVVVGAGTLAAVGRDAGALRLWVQSALAGDVADVVLAASSWRQLGVRGALIAALTPLPLVVAGVLELRVRSTQSVGSAT